MPRNISGSFRWQKVTASGEGLCLQQCRLREDCAAIIFSAGTCELMVSDGNESFVPEALALVRLNNCSEQDASLNLTVPDAQYLQGEFSVMNVYHDTASYSRPGSNPKRQLLLSRTENVQQIPTSCAKPLGLCKTSYIGVLNLRCLLFCRQECEREVCHRLSKKGLFRRPRPRN